MRNQPRRIARCVRWSDTQKWVRGWSRFDGGFGRTYALVVGATERERMRKSKFTEEQIAMAIRQHEAGTTVGEICRKLEISDTTFFRWQQHYAGMGVTELRELRQLRDENRKLKGLVADLSLDKRILQEALRREW